MEESLGDHRKSLAAPLIFVIVVIFQFLTKYLERMKKRATMSDADLKLRAEIKQLLKEASSLSQPSTFAQAAKLRRMAAAKERELGKNQELQSKQLNLSFSSYGKALMILKVVTYSALILWFWRIPVSVISQQLVQPFERILSWRAGGIVNDNVMVGIIPWLILSTRVGKIISKKFFK